jgi:hypothetical protein
VDSSQMKQYEEPATRRLGVQRRYNLQDAANTTPVAPHHCQSFICLSTPSEV